MAITKNIFQDIKQADFFFKCIQVYHTSGIHHIPRKSSLSVGSYFKVFSQEIFPTGVAD